MYTEQLSSYILLVNDETRATHEQSHAPGTSGDLKKKIPFDLCRSVYVRLCVCVGPHLLENINWVVGRLLLSSW